MDADALDSTNVRRYWGNVDGEIMSGWELAVEWDVHGTPPGRARSTTTTPRTGGSWPSSSSDGKPRGAPPNPMTDDPMLARQFAPAGDDGRIVAVDSVAAQDFAIAALDHEVARRDREIAAYDRAIAAELRQGSERLAARLRAFM